MRFIREAGLRNQLVLGLLGCGLAAQVLAADTPPPAPLRPKLNAAESLAQLKAGNIRFYTNHATNPNTSLERLKQAGAESQADHAYATILTCSDSRIPVERIFDAGVMDLFVVRVAGNVCDTDESGSIEYGIAHVRTPVLVVMGHTQCGAVTAVAGAKLGQAHALERNIPPLVENIGPAVDRAMKLFPGLEQKALLGKAIEENVWQAISELFMASPTAREMAKNETLKILGAIYDVGSGKVEWLSESKVHRILGQVELDPNRAIEAMAHGASHPAVHPAAPSASQTKGHGPAVSQDAGPAPHSAVPEAAPAAHAPADAKTDSGSGPHPPAREDRHGAAPPAPHGAPASGRAGPGTEASASGRAAEEHPKEKTGTGQPASKEGEKGSAGEAASAEHAQAAPAGSGGMKNLLMITAGVIFVLGLALVGVARIAGGKGEEAEGEEEEEGEE